ncbi:MAG: crossover junction endodeoxyribonuclease RuvC [Leptospiraceae bacterium]|nr:crossover junction endodeoxyribonuclease RuvC [Leptospiraceae bacterium]
MRILGLDPGYGRTGWGVVEYLPKGNPDRQLQALEFGVMETASADSLSVRLYELQRGIQAIIARHRPEAALMERLFFNQSTTTAAGVYQAQGVLLAALGAAEIECLELTPGQIKQAVTGSGRAGKPAVMDMVCRLLNIKAPIRPDDAADALAAAIAGVHTVRSRKLMQTMRSPQ